MYKQLCASPEVLDHACWNQASGGDEIWSHTLRVSREVVHATTQGLMQYGAY